MYKQREQRIDERFAVAGSEQLCICVLGLTYCGFRFGSQFNYPLYIETGRSDFVC